MRTLMTAGFLLALASPTLAQRVTTGQQSLGQAATGGFGTGGFGGGSATGQPAGNFQSGQLSTDAGSAEGVNRTFGEGLIGRGDTAGRFVGSNQASETGGQSQRPNFSNLERQRATPPRPPASPVRATLRVNFPLLPERSIRISPVLQAGRAATGRALQRVSPTLNADILGEQAVLRGTVDSEHQRKLAAALLRLSPGVQSVDDRAVRRVAAPPLPQ